MQRQRSSNSEPFSYSVPPRYEFFATFAFVFIVVVVSQTPTRDGGGGGGMAENHGDLKAG